MTRLDPVIAELEAARKEAIQRFADQANMPVSAFLRHFRVIMQSSPGEGAMSFKVEPKD